jgi:hypothetical protein
MLVKCGERVGTKVLKVLNMRMCKITDEVSIADVVFWVTKMLTLL